MFSRRCLSAIAITALGLKRIRAQHAAVQGSVPENTIWLNANENPEGPPLEEREAIANAIADAGRYNHRVFPELNRVLAAFVGVDPEQLTVGAGSTEVL